MRCDYPNCEAGSAGTYCRASCVKLTNDRAAAVDQNYYWQPPHTCPLSAKVQLLTQGGVAVYGHYTPSGGYLGWAPLPKKPEWMK
jgi:hypothetical protein